MVDDDNVNESISTAAEPTDRSSSQAQDEILSHFQEVTGNIFLIDKIVSMQ